MVTCGVLGLGAMGACALWPVRADAREALFEIPEGTFARRMAGAENEILPKEIHLVLGVKDVLLLRNRDVVPQIFGPTLIMPGQSFRMPFDQASEYEFACTAHRSGQLRIVVEGGLAAYADRLRARLGGALRAVSKLTSRGGVG